MLHTYRGKCFSCACVGYLPMDLDTWGTCACTHTSNFHEKLPSTSPVLFSSQLVFMSTVAVELGFKANRARKDETAQRLSNYDITYEYFLSWMRRERAAARRLIRANAPTQNGLELLDQVTKLDNAAIRKGLVNHALAVRALKRANVAKERGRGRGIVKPVNADRANHLNACAGRSIANRGNANRQTGEVNQDLSIKVKFEDDDTAWIKVET